MASRKSTSRRWKQAQDVLDGYFNVEPADSRALKLRIDELAKQPVTVQVPTSHRPRAAC